MDASDLEGYLEMNEVYLREGKLWKDIGQASPSVWALSSSALE